ncbi:diadenylate cyclase CdaA [Zunongwangia endophytica]|uniref:Diadenylate cyclase n=1 Tax=Zunongwangia endophytica TaxID=1808945 RepID=A0ABV8HFQ9_9FLAO|nr:diadenylate cyclase CdaA [Zunongwangia endophytica]MDN3596787.1 diadenylate cyclase CdaA [Zunongwangia endophytica]
MDILSIRFLDILDILLIAMLLYYVYKLVRGTVAVNIFIGIVIIYLVWRLTQLLQMELLSSVLDQFVGVGMFALIVVFQQEIRKFLLMIGSANITKNGRFFRSLKFTRNDDSDDSATKVDIVVDACETMGRSKTGALIVIKRSNKLDFVKNSGDEMNIELNQPIIESIFFKNSPLHDGAMVIEENKVTATRVILPVSNDRSIPLRFGLRHRAAVGITEKTDALALVVSEETGQISYIRDGEFTMFESNDELRERLKEDLR